MGHIFISYSHADKTYAHKLRDALHSKGFDVWIDDRIDYGSEWTKVIQQKLDTCDAFIVVMSPQSLASDWVQNELNRAKRKRKPIFPMLLEGDEPWFAVESTHYVDVRDRSLPPDGFYSHLATVVPSVLEANPPTTKPLPQPPVPPRKRFNWSQFWNAKRKRIAARIGIGTTIFVFVSLLLFALGNAIGFINIDNTVIAPSSLISNLVTTSDKNSLSNIFSFPKDRPIYVRFDLNSHRQTVYISRWYYVVDLFGNKLNFLVATITYTSDASDTHVYFQVDDLTIPGNYRVDVYNDETLIGRRYFTAD